MVSVFLIAACTPTGIEPAATQPESTQAPEIGALVPFGQPDVRDLGPTTEVVPNCAGQTEPIVKHPSMTTVTLHSVEWEVGGSAGVGLTIGEGVIPGGVNLEGVLERQVSNEIGSQVQQSNAWDLPAEPGYIVEYTVMWREIWQTGYMDVTFLDPAPRIERINLTYRTGIQSDIIGQKPTRCDTGNQPIDEQVQEADSANLDNTGSDASDTIVEDLEALTETTSADEQVNTGSASTAASPARTHTPFSAGDGVFANVTDSDGQANISSAEIGTNHQHIQRIRREEQPSGCDRANYASEKVWVSGTPGMKLTLNGEVVGTYLIAPDAHGYMLDLSVSLGDELCAVDVGPEGFSIIFGPDVYYHYDSYCFRTGC